RGGRRMGVEGGVGISEQTGQPVLAAEFYRARGELVLAAPDGGPAQAESFFRRALEIAQAQEARSLELRAAMSLAHLLRTQERADEARALLTPLYAWFTEGFDTSAFAGGEGAAGGARRSQEASEVSGHCLPHRV